MVTDDKMTKKRQTRPRKHVPLRTCIVCRQQSDKRELTRIVRNPDEGVIVDPTGKKNGRGAYLCTNPACWERAIKTQALERALKTTLTEVERDTLLQYRPDEVIPQ